MSKAKREELSEKVRRCLAPVNMEKYRVEDRTTHVAGVPPDFKQARQHLAEARQMLAESAQGAGPGRRQDAAERGWLAAATAARALSACVLRQKVPASSGIVDQVGRIEERAHLAPDVSDTLRQIQATMHGGCHYRADWESCADKYLLRDFERAEGVIDATETMCATLAPRQHAALRAKRR